MISALSSVLLATSLALATGQAKPAPKKAKTIRLDTEKIEGRIQKPQAFYILQRSALSFDELNRSESFLKKIPDAVKKAPF